jgi:hypothetical protein
MKKTKNKYPGEWKLIADNVQYVSEAIKRKKLEMNEKEIKWQMKEALENIDTMILTLYKVFWTFKEVKTFEYPTEWIDAFKVKYFPPLLLKLFPVHITKITIKEVVPQLPPKFKSKLLTRFGDRTSPISSYRAPEEYEIKWEKKNS